MKYLYYLTATLDSTRKITDGLHQAGIDDWFIHVLSKDEAGLKKDKIHSSNYLEQLDILRYGIIGAALGLVAGVLAVIYIDAAQLFGTAPSIVYYAIIGVSILFGAWEGGLIGIAAENKKIALFHDDLEAGGYLLLIYAKQAVEERVKTVMAIRCPEAKLAAVDAHFYNPLTDLKRVTL